MAILDNLARPIEKGDLILFTSGESFAFEVVEVKEASLLGDPRQMPVGNLVLKCEVGKALPNPQRSPNMVLSDVLIVSKGEKLEDQQPGSPLKQ